ncbi:hypothetical protein FRZ44_38220 [Hypericibacter terrae]|uniref:Uncharacterized protein n=1 Tax=Hypericibacter terrae TaxID=2602015 RepID=A0A5J6MPG0_9PROT|nr:hypothetical protein [Hypericibacter terrae]QEX18515.1 hypothetical protein FRZ44_38220 [Hypericibacter terrae]
MSAPADLAWLRGVVARLEGKTRAANPYGDRHEEPLALIWQGGWRGQRPAATFHVKQDERQPASLQRPCDPTEAIRSAGPGRGHGWLGLRSEWGAVELNALDLMGDADWPTERMGVVLRRTEAAIRTQLHRRRRTGAAA